MKENQMSVQEMEIKLLQKKKNETGKRNQKRERAQERGESECEAETS